MNKNNDHFPKKISINYMGKKVLKNIFPQRKKKTQYYLRVSPSSSLELILNEDQSPLVQSPLGRIRNRFSTLKNMSYTGESAQRG